MTQIKFLCPLAVIFFFILGGCNNGNLEKCRQYVGRYNDRGQSLTIKYENKEFILEEAGQKLPCACTEKGQLEIKGKVSAVIILSDSAGKKRFCFEADSLKEDCIYTMEE